MIDFTLDSVHQELQDMYRKFAEERVKPLAHEMDEKEVYDRGLLKEMQDCGFFGIPFSEEYGGAGADILAYAMAVEEMARVCTTTSVALSARPAMIASAMPLA